MLRVALFILVLVLIAPQASQASFSVTCKVSANVMSVTPIDEQNSWVGIYVTQADLRQGEAQATDCMFMFNRQRERTIKLPLNDISEGESLVLRFKHVDTGFIDEFGHRQEPKEQWGLWGVNFNQLKKIWPWNN